MGIINKALLGAAVYFGYKYLTKKDALTGRTVVDDLVEEAPKWIEKAKTIVNTEKEIYKENITL